MQTSFFEGGRTNIAYNCLDRNIEQGRGAQPCFLWEVRMPNDMHRFSLFALPLLAVYPHVQPAASGEGLSSSRQPTEAEMVRAHASSFAAARRKLPALLCQRAGASSKHAW